MSFWGSPPWNIGIDWVGIRRRKVTGLLAAVPFLEQSGRLLYGASMLWPGRVRGKELRTFAWEVFSLGGRLRRNAIIWQVEDHFLSTLMTERHLGEPRELPAKHPGAAALLAWSGLQLASLACMTIRHVDGLQQLDRGDYEKIAEGLEDRIEVVSESPACSIQQPPLTNTMAALHDCAIEQLCEILCRATGDFCAMLNCLPKDAAGEAHREWHRRGRIHQLSADELFGAFANGAVDQETARAVLSGRPTEYPSSPGEMGRYQGVDGANRASAKVSAFIELLQGMRVKKAALVRTK
jgi:hypothetical protein